MICINLLLFYSSSKDYLDVDLFFFSWASFFFFNISNFILFIFGHAMWDLSSLARDCIHAPCTGSAES